MQGRSPQWRWQAPAPTGAWVLGTGRAPDVGERPSISRAISRRLTESRAVSFQAVLISVGFGVGLLVSHLSHVAIYWLVVTVTIWSICILLGNLSESVRVQADTDHLTGLLNRSGFLAAALRERSLADRTGAPLSVALIDLDRFKEINDRAGHAAGDELLAELAMQWRRRMRPSGILARHGGDEFVLLLPCTWPSGADAALRRLRGDEDTVGWSVGISEWASGEDLDAPLARARTSSYMKRSSLGDEAASRIERRRPSLLVTAGRCRSAERAAADLPALAVVAL